MSTPVLGVQMYTLREHCNDYDELCKTLERVKKMGYTAIQVSGIPKVSSADIAKAAKEQGLTICITHMGWDRFKEDLDGVIADHKLYNCTHTAIGGLFGDPYFSVDGIKQFAEEFGPVAERLAAEGMDFSYHNHDHEFVRFDGELWHDLLFAAVDSPVFKAEIDTYWVASGGGEPSAWIRKFAGRMPVIHYKDMKFTAEKERRFCPIGEGNLNWAGIIEATKEAGVDYACIELDNCYGDDPFDYLERSYKFLSSMGLK